MSLEADLHQELLNNYTLAGRETGYWARYYLKALRKKAAWPQLNVCYDQVARLA